MSLAELRTPPELAAHYSAVRARLWAPPRHPLMVETNIPPQLPPLPQPPDVENVAARWRDIDDRVFGSRVSAKAVIDVTAAYFKIPVRVVCGKSRREDTAKARQSAIYLIRELCRQFRATGDTVKVVRFSFLQTASYFSIDHATAVHTIARVRRRMEKDEKYATAISELMALLQRGEKK